MPTKSNWIKHSTNRSGEAGLVEIWPLQEKVLEARQVWEIPIKQVNFKSSESE